jgi:hypothetical protein
MSCSLRDGKLVSKSQFWGIVEFVRLTALVAISRDQALVEELREAVSLPDATRM